MNTRSRRTAAVLGLALLVAGPSSAQTPQEQAGPESRSRWELLVPSGSLVPTGGQRGAIKRANLTAVQAIYAAHPSIAITAVVGWARSRDIASAEDPKLDVFSYDLGGELRAPRSIVGGAVNLRPFVGIGAGARSYNYRKLDVDARHNVAAYGSVGGELGRGRIRVRLEARDYVTGFKPLRGSGSTDTRNDVVVMVGLRLVRR